MPTPPMPTPPPIDLFQPNDPSAGMGGFFVLFILIALGAWLVPKLINLSHPEVTRQARVVSKRTSVGGDHARTWYYVTFQFEGGEREEFGVSGSEYGLMAEGDEGTLVSQGTEVRSFTRLGQPQ